MDFFFTNDVLWIEKWDCFLQENDKGSHLLLSDWLRSYTNYGFDFEVGITIINDQIIGGFGAVIAKASFFKFYIVPFGPIISKENENEIDFLVNKVKSRAIEKKCCYAQISLPILSNDNPIANHGFFSKIKVENSFYGSKFKYIYPAYGINWVTFSENKTSTQLLNSFPIQTRRNINIALKHDIDFEIVKSYDKIKIAYNLIEKNALDNNYSVRSWKSFETTLINLVEKNLAVIILAKNDNNYKGSLLMIESGNYYTYISGGTTKEKPDLKMGYFLHWQAMLLGLAKGHKGYNISLGGSNGVVTFKSKFNTQTFLFDNGVQHWVLQPRLFYIYEKLNIVLKNNKFVISKIISKLKFQKHT